MTTRTIRAANDGSRGVDLVQEVAGGRMEVAMALRGAIGF